MSESTRPDAIFFFMRTSCAAAHAPQMPAQQKQQHSTPPTIHHVGSKISILTTRGVNGSNCRSPTRGHTSPVLTSSCHVRYLRGRGEGGGVSDSESIRARARHNASRKRAHRVPKWRVPVSASRNENESTDTDALWYHTTPGSDGPTYRPAASRQHADGGTPAAASPQHVCESMTVSP